MAEWHICLSLVALEFAITVHALTTAHDYEVHILNTINIANCNVTINNVIQKQLNLAYNNNKCMDKHKPIYACKLMLYMQVVKDNDKF